MRAQVRTRDPQEDQMHYTVVHYIAFACAAIAVAAGIAGAYRTRGGFRSRSAAMYTRATLVTAAGFAAGLIFGSERLFLGGVSLGMLLVATGFFLQSKEGETFHQLASEQRVDVISGLPNERLFHERLFAEHSRTKRTHQRYSIAVFEIDEYALLSDDDKTNGMKLLAESLNESIRNTDTLGRLGEQQVGVLLVDTLTDGAAIGCDRARERFFFRSCGHSETAHVTRPLTVSAGIAAFDDDTIDPNHVVENAKLALKRMRDRIDSGIEVYDHRGVSSQADNDFEALGSA